MKKIKIIAPSSCATEITSADLDHISAFFKKLKYDISFGKYSFEKYHFFAGTDEQRMNDLENAFADEEADILIILRGGSGSLHLLDKIDYTILSKNPKPFFGFSDSTVLQNAFYTKIGLPSFSGFWARTATEKLPTLTKRTLIKCLNNEEHTFRIPFLAKGKADGILLGGNLRMFTSLLGTPYFPDMTGKILIVEDIGEAPYKIDNMFMQLKLAGVLGKIKGLILGDFSRVGTKQDEKVLNALLKEYFTNAPYPVARFKRYSHEPGHVVIPFGGMIHLDSDKGILVLDKIKKYK